MKENASTILTITGSDGTGGSGVQADIRTIHALGGHAVSAITSITLQNTLGIQEFHDLPASIIAGQIEAIMDDVRPQAVKIGMVRSVATVDVIVDILQRYRPPFVVYDPVVTSTRGEQLMTPEVLAHIQERLLPLCNILIAKHKDGVKVYHDGRTYTLQSGIQWDMHGLGGTFSSAIAALLTKGMPVEQAVEQAKAYLNRQMAYADNLQGRGAELYHEFIDLIAAHHATNSDVRFYADRLNVSSRYLAQVTRRMAGQSPKALIDEYLLKEIKIALSTTEHTIQEIAYQFGFHSQAHFTKFFRKMTGKTPSNFKKAKKS